MNALLVYPRFPITYWGLQYGLRLVGKRASLPPLGLLTVAALLPSDWHVRLVDLNVDALKDDDLRWADIVLTGGLLIQAESMQKIISRAVAWKRPVAIGGPAPRFDLLDLSKYASVSVQYSRGCPFNCEFCDVIEIFGRKPRVKTPGQVLAELEEIHPILGEWQRARERPFDIYTEASVDLVMEEAALLGGYLDLMKWLYSPEAYYSRCEPRFVQTTPSSGAA